VVFCDIFMGEQEGLTTIRLLRAEFPGVRIVAMSGGSAIGDYLSDARLMGAAATLAKPFGMVALRSVLTQLGHNTPAVTAS
jgi:CheY-like chemotaxis protein